MKDFLGPIHGYPPLDSSDEDDDDDTYYIHPIYFPEDAADDTDDINQNEFFEAVLNADHIYSSEESEAEDDDLSMNDDDSYVPDSGSEEDDSEETNVEVSPNEGDADAMMESDNECSSNDNGEEAPSFSPCSVSNEPSDKPVNVSKSENPSERALDTGEQSGSSSGKDISNIEPLKSEPHREQELNTNPTEPQTTKSKKLLHLGSPSRSPCDSPFEVKSQEVESRDSDGSFEKEPLSYREEFRSEPTSEAEEVDDEEQFCNPMASADDEHNEDALRGDRIGSTTYSERHVLRLLMRWIEKLRLISKGLQAEETEKSVDVNQDSESLDLETEEAMSLLWDMSAESDVMHFLMSHNILAIIRDNLDSSGSPARLKEVALGILANLLSCASILEDFPDKDEHLHLVERIVMEGLTSTDVPFLTQVYAVLRRVACYIRNAKPLDRWMALLMHQDFINAANFLLKSSTNAILLGDVIVTLFTLMEVLSPPHESEDITDEEKQSLLDKLTENFKPFCSSDFVPSICEGLNELLKDGRIQDPANSTFPRQRPTDSTKQPSRGTTGNPEFYDLFIPPGHIQNAVLNGIASLSYLQKFKTGQDALGRCHASIQDMLVTFFEKFLQYTDLVHAPDIVDYFAISIELLTFCHIQRNEVVSSVLVTPAKTAIALIDNEKDKKNETHMVTIGKENSSVEVELQSSQVSPYSLIFYNYLVSVEEKFGKEPVKSVFASAKRDKLRVFYDKIHAVADNVHSKVSSDT